MVDIKILCYLLGRAVSAMAIAYLVPIFYALSTGEIKVAAFFAALSFSSEILSIIFLYKGKLERQRIKISESAATIILVWPLLTLTGAIPFTATYWLSPSEAILETVSDLTSAGISLLPSNIHFALQLWQAVLMWLGSLIFLNILVTILPEVSGCFGLELSLSQGQIFSPMVGQMKYMARKILKIYSLLTALSFFLFRLAGLDSWNALSMAMRCVSTGGGGFFPGKGNIYVEYAAIFSMLMACGNFLLYFRLLNTIVPPDFSLIENKPSGLINFSKRIHAIIIKFFVLMRNNFRSNIKILFSNSEIKFLTSSIFFVTLFILFTTFTIDGNKSFRIALFNTVSYISTTGLSIGDVASLPNYDRLLLFIMAAIGGCMGSVTGGLKIIRVIVLFKLAMMEILKTLHPRMITSIKVSTPSASTSNTKASVPLKIVGRILGFFFLCALTLFICSVLLSLSGQSLSTSVAMSLACLTNIGTLPGICEASTFSELPILMKMLCCVILVIGRVEIFAFLILIVTVAGGGSGNSSKQKW